MTSVQHGPAQEGAAETPIPHCFYSPRDAGGWPAGGWSFFLAGLSLYLLRSYKKGSSTDELAGRWNCSACGPTSSPGEVVVPCPSRPRPSSIFLGAPPSSSVAFYTTRRRCPIFVKHEGWKLNFPGGSSVCSANLQLSPARPKTPFLKLAMANNSNSAVKNGQSLPETASRCLTESFTATHNFELTSYPLLEGLGVGKYVISSVFSVGGYDWTIRFYPDGEKDVDSAGYTSAFLFCVSQVKEDVRTKFTLNMLEIDGKVGVTNHGVLQHVFSPASMNFGYPKLVEKSKMKSKSGCLMRCVLTVIKEPRTEESKRNLSVVSQLNLQDHLQQMLKDGQGADITFSVGGQLFSAHRCLLAARSSVFKAELFGPMKGKSTQCIKVDDIEPSIFEALLHFVYTDSLVDDEHYKEGRIAKFQHLLVTADRYGLDKLRVLCERKLCESMDVETAATTLVLAEQHHCKDLKEACVEFMAPRNVLQAVLATDGFKHLVESCPVVMKEILDMVSRSG